MFIRFFYYAKRAGLTVSMVDLFHLLEALDKEVVGNSVDDFYYLCKATWVKSEHQYDLFDRVFGSFFHGVEGDTEDFKADIPEEWLKKGKVRDLSDEDKKKIEALGGLDKLIDRMKELLKEQEKRHGGGNKWIGTGGTSPFGAYGYNPEGIRVGQQGAGAGKAAKVWDKREFKNLSGDMELNTRTMKMALKRLRILTREGLPTELDLDDTIRKTSENAGYLDIALQAQKRNNVKVLLFFDVGGSMDGHIEACERLFTAARYEFKHMEYFYFHNCIYEGVWKDNRRRWNEKTSTYDVLHKYNSDYKVIFVGDASMGPYELTYAGGSVEHHNQEAGFVWLERLRDHFKSVIWLNPTHLSYWQYSESTQMLQQFFNNRMFPLTLQGLASSMKALKNPKLTFEKLT